MHALTTAGAGFLAAVIWFDLMFDVQVRRSGGRGDALPEPVLASIAAYYRRVTTDARPMNRLVMLAMVATLGGIAGELVGDAGPSWAVWLSLALAMLPIGIAATRTVPAAVRLGQRGDPRGVQAALARRIFTEHVVCLAGIATLLTLQLAVVR